MVKRNQTIQLPSPELMLEFKVFEMPSYFNRHRYSGEFNPPEDDEEDFDEILSTPAKRLSASTPSAPISTSTSRQTAGPAPTTSTKRVRSVKRSGGTASKKAASSLNLDASMPSPRHTAELVEAGGSSGRKLRQNTSKKMKSSVAGRKRQVAESRVASAALVETISVTRESSVKQDDTAEVVEERSTEMIESNDPMERSQSLAAPSELATAPSLISSSSPTSVTQPNVATFLASLPLPLFHLHETFTSLGCSSSTDLIALSSNTPMGVRCREAMLDAVEKSYSGGLSKWERIVLIEGLRSVSN